MIKKIIALTTPRTMVSDIDELEKSKWDIIVIDEGHRAKNLRTKFRKTIKEMKVRLHKVILTILQFRIIF
jgi:SNF2 family DNA or RNA helicase